MGREYRRWLIAKGNTFIPGSAAIAKLVERLKKERWIAEPASDSFKRLRFTHAPLAAKTGGFAKVAVEVDGAKTPAAGWEATPHPLDASWIGDPKRSDLVLRWPVRVEGAWPEGPAALRYPLTRLADTPAPLVYNLEIHRAEDFVYPISGCIDAIATECACGEDLAFEWDEDEIKSPFGASTGVFWACSECSRTFDPSRHEADVADAWTGEKVRVRGGAAYRFALVIDCGECFPGNAPMPSFHPDLIAACEAEFGRDFYEVGSID